MKNKISLFSEKYIKKARIAGLYNTYIPKKWIKFFLKINEKNLNG